jgi:hypothetical protein
MWRFCAGNLAASISVYAALRRDRPRSSAVKNVYGVFTLFIFPRPNVKIPKIDDFEN